MDKKGECGNYLENGYVGVGHGKFVMKWSSAVT